MDAVLAPRRGASAAAVTALGFAPDGRRLLVGHADGALQWWDVATARPASEPLTTTGGAPLALAPLDARTGLVVRAGDDYLTLLDLDTGAPSARFGPRHPYRILTAVCAQRRVLVEQPARLSQLTVWDVVARRRRAVLKGHRFSIGSFAVSADGTTVISAGSDDETLRAWDAATGAQRWQERPAEAVGYALALAPDGETLAWRTWGAVVAREARRGGAVRWRHEPAEPADQEHLEGELAWAPDGAALWSLYGAHVLALDPRDGAARARLRWGGEGALSRLALSPGGSFLAAGGAEGELALHQLRPPPA